MDLRTIVYSIFAFSLISFLLFIFRLILTDNIHDILAWIFFGMCIGLFIIGIFAEHEYFEVEKARILGKPRKKRFRN